MKQKTLYVLLLAVLFLVLAVADSYAKAPQPVKEGTTPVKPAVAQTATEQIQPAVFEGISANFLTGERIDWQVLSSGGTDGSSSNFKMKGTVSQTVVGPGNSTNFRLNSGFWQDFGVGGCCAKGGDANHDGKLNLLDVSYIINKLYRSGPDFVCFEEADAKADGKINLLDVSYIINALYRGGPKPICP
jgi:hypothetical protein